MKCSNENYKLLHPYYYPTNHAQVGLTSAGPCILPETTVKHKNKLKRVIKNLKRRLAIHIYISLIIDSALKLEIPIRYPFGGRNDTDKIVAVVLEEMTVSFCRVEGLGVSAVTDDFRELVYGPECHRQRVDVNH